MHSAAQDTAGLAHKCCIFLGVGVLLELLCAQLCGVEQGSPRLLQLRPKPGTHTAILTVVQ